MAKRTFEGNFANVMEGIRRTFVLPHERALESNSYDDLLKIIRMEQAQDRALRLNALTMDEQLSIYCLYAEALTSGERRIVDGLVIQYASWSLFDAGWSAFQIQFPNAALQRSLAWLWRYLVNAGDRVGAKPLYYCDHLFETVNLNLSAADFLSQSLKLMMQEFAGQSDSHALDQYLYAKNLIPGSMFTAMLLDLWARGLSDDELYRHYRVMLPSWSVLPPTELAKLLQRILTSTNLMDTQRSEMLHALMDQMDRSVGDGSGGGDGSGSGDGSGGRNGGRSRATADALPEAIREIWEAWRILDVIKYHYGARPTKREFILNFHAKIKSVERIDASTIAWDFGHFYLVDTLGNPDRSFVYPEKIYRNALESTDTFGNLGDPNVSVRSIDLPDEQASSQSIIELYFVEPSLSKAKAYMRAKFRQLRVY